MDRVARLIELPTVTEVRGNLSYLEAPDQVPFAIGQVTWIDLAALESAGDLLQSDVEQVLVALAGRVEVLVDGAGAEQRYTLTRPCIALYVPPSGRRWLSAASPDALLLMLSPGTAPQ